MCIHKRDYYVERSYTTRLLWKLIIRISGKYVHTAMQYSKVPMNNAWSIKNNVLFYIKNISRIKQKYRRVFNNLIILWILMEKNNLQFSHEIFNFFSVRRAISIIKYLRSLSHIIIAGRCFRRSFFQPESLMIINWYRFYRKLF